MAKKNEREVTYLEAIRQALAEEMARDKSVFIIGEDVGAYGGAFGVTKGLFEEFGEQRVIDTPISEALIAGAATGAAMLGMRPVAEMQFADFISCAFDQVVNQAATLRYRMAGKVSAPWVIRMPSGGNIHGSMYHSQNPEGWFFHTPGLKIVCPSTPYDAKGLLKAAIRDDDPVLYFEYKYLYRRLKQELPADDYIVPLGKADLRREGRDLSIITYGAQTVHAMAAADQLAADGVDCEVIDLRSLCPLDKETVLQSVEKTSKVLITHEDWERGGVGAEIAAMLAEEMFEHLDGPILRVASLNIPVPFSPPLEEFYLPTVEKIAEAARRLAAY
ncbi:MAG: alpha-ketoacid dehydrogenase subunit beta [Planctomycetes bacterium]|nr:alpha-ketoacid dehydrogenase subunit beta [Planctomycetota bacterium]